MTPIRRWTRVLLLVVSVLAGGPTAWAQATFSVSSTASTVIRTGHAELVGGLTFSIVAGTTVAGSIEIDLSPAVLTSRAIDIPSSAFSATVDPEAGRVELHVPAGIGQGMSVNVEGLRLSVPDSGIETLDARISTTENRLVAGNRVVPVIARVADAIVIDPSTDSVYTYSSVGAFIDPLGHFTFSEGFAQAFADDTDAGRTAPTETIFQVSALPRNTQLRFPARIESQTGATLTTATGEDVTLAAGRHRNRVVYTFSSSASSRSVVDVFSFRPVLERTGPAGAGTGFYQVTIGPIGRRSSTAVPHYEALLLPVLPALPPPKTFLFPVERGVEAQSFTVSNTSDGAAPLTIQAFDEAGELREGADGVNARSRLLGARQTLTFDLESMFGTGATAGTVASLAIESKNDRAVATTIGTTPGGAYALRSQTPVEPAYFPFDRRDPGEMPLVGVVGEGAADFESRWTLMDTAGVEQASFVREVGARDAVRDSLDALFGITTASVPLAGYVRVESLEAQFRGSLLDNPGKGTHAVPALRASGTSRLVFPYFVIGGGYNTVLTLINASDQTAVVTATAFDTAGVEVAPGFTIRILPKAMDDLDWAAILGTGGGLRQGYFKLSIEPVFRPNPFISGPHLAGSVRIEAPVSRAAAPLLNARGEEFFFTPVRSDGSEYTGLAILNEGAEEIEVIIEAYDANGKLLDATEEALVIAAGASRIGLLRELLPELGSADGGYLRVASPSIQMRALALRGRLDSTTLLHLAAQTAP